MKLFEPCRLGQLRLKNRLVMTAMTTRLAEAGGRVSQGLMAYYAARAAGGVGLVTVEEAYLHPQIPHVQGALGIFGDHLIPGLAHLIERVHDEGAAVSLQIGHYFRQAVNGFPRYVASRLAPDATARCKELAASEIAYLVVLFAAAAGRAKAAGFDAVEVHACHGCIISEFLSPFWNHRKDDYGGTPENRFRFALEILKAIRQEVGPAYPVIFRISGSEFHAGGFSPLDGVSLSQALEKAGVSAISVSGGLGHVNHLAIPPSDVPRGIFLPLAADIKDKVSVPVIAANSLTPQMAEDALAKGQADLIGLGRPLIADPQWPRKVQEGRLDEVRHCLRCNQGCFGALKDERIGRVTCLYNPQAGRETQRKLAPAQAAKKIVVVGGGPAGCEAARVARLRGHQVVLFEQGQRLGGQFALAAVPPHKADFSRLGEYYGQELPRLGVEVRLGSRATRESLAAQGADVYILAVGSVPSRPSIPGAELGHVVSAQAVLAGEARELLKGPAVVAGGGATGLETADYLAEMGLAVSVLEMLDTPGRDIIAGIGVREALLKRLADKQVEILAGWRLMRIEPEVVVVSDRPLAGGGELRRVPARLVVLALGNRPDLSLMPAGDDGKALWVSVGDCRNPGNALQAVHAAFDLAAAL